MTHIIKFFAVEILGRQAFVSLTEYPQRKFIVRFINDKFSDFVNSFNTKGFGVEVVDEEYIVKHLYGDITDDLADSIWNQIKNRLRTPEHEVKIEGFER
jgi:hypothetical protein